MWNTRYVDELSATDITRLGVDTLNDMCRNLGRLKALSSYVKELAERALALSVGLPTMLASGGPEPVIVRLSQIIHRLSAGNGSNNSENYNNELARLLSAIKSSLSKLVDLFDATLYDSAPIVVAFTNKCDDASIIRALIDEYLHICNYDVNSITACESSVVRSEIRYQFANIGNDVLTITPESQAGIARFAVGPMALNDMGISLELAPAQIRLECSNLISSIVDCVNEYRAHLRITIYWKYPDFALAAMRAISQMLDEGVVTGVQVYQQLAGFKSSMRDAFAKDLDPLVGEASNSRNAVVENVCSIIDQAVAILGQRLPELQEAGVA